MSHTLASDSPPVGRSPALGLLGRAAQIDRTCQPCSLAFLKNPTISLYMLPAAKAGNGGTTRLFGSRNTLSAHYAVSSPRVTRLYGRSVARFFWDLFAIACYLRMSCVRFIRRRQSDIRRPALSASSLLARANDVHTGLRRSSLLLQLSQQRSRLTLMLYCDAFHARETRITVSPSKCYQSINFKGSEP